MCLFAAVARADGGATSASGIRYSVAEPGPNALLVLAREVV